jgi:hypothetical protein
MIETIRLGDGSATIKRVVGYEDPFTTVVVQSGTRAIIRGFTYAVGYDVSGLTDKRVNATRAETNLNVCSELADESEWLGLEMGIPVVSPARFQADPSGGDYPVLSADVAQFVAKAHIALYTDSDRAFASYAASALDVRQSVARFYQQLTFQDALRYRKNGRLWLEVDWPGSGDPPVFGPHPKTGKPGVLTVTFKLLGKLPQGTDAAPVEIKADLASIVDLLREQNQRISDLIARMPRMDSSVPDFRRTPEARAVAARADESAVAARADTPLSSAASSEAASGSNTTDADSPIDAERFRGLEKGDRK